MAGFKKDEAKFSEGVYNKARNICVKAWAVADGIYNKAIDEAKAKEHQGK